MIETTLRTDGGLDVVLTGADATLVTNLSFEQGIEPDVLLRRLIEQAALSGASHLPMPRLVGPND